MEELFLFLGPATYRTNDKFLRPAAEVAGDVIFSFQYLQYGWLAEAAGRKEQPSQEPLEMQGAPSGKTSNRAFCWKRTFTLIPVSR